jgi:voltage-gated potassium channel
MSEARASRSELKSVGYEFFVGALSVLSLVNIVLAAAIEDQDLTNILLVMNGVLSAVFMIDFVYRLATAPSRSTYFFRRFGWADLLASTPLSAFKVLRIFRLVLVYRLMTDLGRRAVATSLARERAGNALLTLLLIGFLLLEFGSLNMLYLEQQSPDANITNTSDALWYTMVTISTVGYGDHYPVTTGGRILGTLIIVIGVGIFGAFTGYLANAFIAPRRHAAGRASHTQAPTETPTQTLDELRRLVADPDATLDKVQRLLATNPATDTDAETR